MSYELYFARVEFIQTGVLRPNCYYSQTEGRRKVGRTKWRRLEAPENY
jgi:hypothetical protein